MGCFDARMDFDFFFNARHFFRRNVHNFHGLASVYFSVRILDLRDVARLANAPVLPLAQKFVQENHVVVNDARIGTLII